MTMKIYTRTGDDGKTGLIGGARVSKHHIRVECYGTVDELNSLLGLVRAQTQEEGSLNILSEIQDRLFTLGAYLAAAPGNKMILPELREDDIHTLEKEIDRLTGELPELKNFILPGATVPGANAHVARCVCRRAERAVVYLSEQEEIDAMVLRYLNRLSDYLFTLARFLDKQNGGAEITWAPRK
jgi:cob(I)alamin adenosyltransferase